MKRNIINYELLQKKIKAFEFLNDSQTEALVYGLEEIQNSLNIIYNNVIPKLLEENLDKEKALEFLWDLREEFRHLEYHIKDSDVLDL